MSVDQELCFVQNGSLKLNSKKRRSNGNATNQSHVLQAKAPIFTAVKKKRIIQSVKIQKISQIGIETKLGRKGRM